MRKATFLISLIACLCVGVFGDLDAGRFYASTADHACLAPFLSGTQTTYADAKNRLAHKTDPQIIKTAGGYFYSGPKRTADRNFFAQPSEIAIKRCLHNPGRFMVSSNASQSDEESVLVEFPENSPESDVEIFIPAAGDSKGWFVLLDEVAKLDPEFARASADLKLRFLQFWNDRKKRQTSTGYYGNTIYTPVSNASNQAIVAAFFKNHPVMRHILSKLADGSVSYGAKLRYAGDQDEQQDESGIKNIMSAESGNMQAAVADSARIMFDRVFGDNVLPESLLRTGRAHLGFINAVNRVDDFAELKLSPGMTKDALKQMVVELMGMVFQQESSRNYYDRFHNFVCRLEVFESDVKFLEQAGFLPADHELGFTPKKDYMGLGVQALENGNLGQAETLFSIAQTAPNSFDYARAAKAYEKASNFVGREDEAASWYLKSARQKFDNGQFDQALADAAIAAKFSPDRGAAARRIFLDAQRRLFETFSRSA